MRVFPPFIFTKRPKTSESNPRSLHRDLILPRQIHMPPTATQLLGASARECNSKNCRTERNDSPGRLLDEPAAEPAAANSVEFIGDALEIPIVIDVEVPVVAIVDVTVPVVVSAGRVVVELCAPAGPKLGPPTSPADEKR